MMLSQARGSGSHRKGRLPGSRWGGKGAAESGRGWSAHMQTSQLRPHTASTFSPLCSSPSTWALWPHLPLLSRHTAQPAIVGSLPHPDPHPSHSTTLTLSHSLPPPWSVSPATSAPLGQMVASSGCWVAQEGGGREGSEPVRQVPRPSR